MWIRKGEHSGDTYAESEAAGEPEMEPEYVDEEFASGLNMPAPLTSGTSQRERRPLVAVRCVLQPAECAINDAGAHIDVSQANCGQPAYSCGQPLSSLQHDDELLVDMTGSELRPIEQELFPP